MKSNKSVKAVIEIATGFEFYSLISDIPSSKRFSKGYKLRDKGKPVSIGVVSLDSNGNIQAASKG